MVCHGGFNLDEATRRSWYDPEAILKNLQPGMTFVDLGCGEGFFSFLAAKKVGKTGKIYAVDIDAQAIEKMKIKAKTAGLTNIEMKVGKAEETVFCKECADMIFFSMDLHDFADPSKVLKNARQMIKPSGVLLDLDWKKMEMPFGPPFQIRFSEEHASGLIEKASFRIQNAMEVGRFHYVITAKPN